MNWKKLKDFCNKLDDKQLEKKVVVWREEEAISKIEPSILEEDHYCSTEYPEDGCVPKSDMPDDFGEAKKVYDKGQPVLWEDF